MADAKRDVPRMCGKQITKLKHMTPTQLLGQLIEEGGAIVTSNECSQMEIVDAHATGRFAVDAECYGYVRRTKEWLAIQKNREAAHPNTGGIYSANAQEEQSQPGARVAATERTK